FSVGEIAACIEQSCSFREVHISEYSYCKDYRQDNQPNYPFVAGAFFFGHKYPLLSLNFCHEAFSNPYSYYPNKIGYELSNSSFRMVVCYNWYCFVGLVVCTYTQLKTPICKNTKWCNFWLFYTKAKDCEVSPTVPHVFVTQKWH